MEILPLPLREGVGGRGPGAGVAPSPSPLPQGEGELCSCLSCLPCLTAPASLHRHRHACSTNPLISSLSLAAGPASPDRPSRRRRPTRSGTHRRAGSRSPLPSSSAPAAAALRNAARSDAAARPCRRGCRTRHTSPRPRRCWRAPASSISATISSTPPGPPRYCPSPPDPGRNSCVRKNSGKRTSVTSRLPNLMPPAACHSPPPASHRPPATRRRRAAPGTCAR